MLIKMINANVHCSILFILVLKFPDCMLYSPFTMTNFFVSCLWTLLFDNKSAKSMHSLLCMFVLVACEISEAISTWKLFTLFGWLSEFDINGTVNVSKLLHKLLPGTVFSEKSGIDPA
jgi:hypothetical protein